MREQELIWEINYPSERCRVTAAGHEVNRAASLQPGFCLFEVTWPRSILEEGEARL